MKTNLKRIRESQGKLQEDVAKDLGISLSAYRSWEQGTRDLNGAKLCKLADYFDVSVDTIIGTEFGADVQGPSLTEAEEALLAVFRSLNEQGKGRLLEYADDLIQSRKYEKKEGAGLSNSASCNRLDKALDKRSPLFHCLAAKQRARPSQKG